MLTPEALEAFFKQLKDEPLLPPTSNLIPEELTTPEWCKALEHKKAFTKLLLASESDYSQLARQVILADLEQGKREEE